MAAGNFAGRRRVEIPVEHRTRRTAERRLRRKSVDHRDVLEDVSHAVAVALSVTLGEHVREQRGIRGGMARTNETAHDLAGCAAHRFGIESVAAEEIDFLQLRKQSWT